ncbi:hypothetical protein ACH5RR_013012 [Cinchona calisaya]|uniref:Uncharacterized protein n=1 Tax=Cinchona calisaya TaxID=153742 RepID=A0ABD3A287_9GENT
MNLSVIRKFTTYLGYEETTGIMYRIPIEDAKNSMLGLENDEHVDDMVALGMIYGEVEIFLVHDFHNRFLENQVKSPIAGFRVNEGSDINLTFRELHVGGDVVLDGSEGEEFHDSEYHFHDNDDEVIYEKFTDQHVDEICEVHPGEALKSRMWACARSPCIRKFEAEKESLKAFDEMAYKWLVENTSPQHWSRSQFRTSPKCDILLNNICESFNLVILDARDRPILVMLEKIRICLTMRLQTKRDWMRRQDVDIRPKVQKQLERLKNDAAGCIATFSDLCTTIYPGCDADEIKFLGKQRDDRRMTQNCGEFNVTKFFTSINCGYLHVVQIVQHRHKWDSTLSESSNENVTDDGDFGNDDPMYQQNAIIDEVLEVEVQEANLLNRIDLEPEIIDVVKVQPRGYAPSRHSTSSVATRLQNLDLSSRIPQSRYAVQTENQDNSSEEDHGRLPRSSTYSTMTDTPVIDSVGDLAVLTTDYQIDKQSISSEFLAEYERSRFCNLVAIEDVECLLGAYPLGWTD